MLGWVELWFSWGFDKKGVWKKFIFEQFLIFSGKTWIIFAQSEDWDGNITHFHTITRNTIVCKSLNKKILNLLFWKNVFNYRPSKWVLVSNGIIVPSSLNIVTCSLWSQVWHNQPWLPTTWAAKHITRYMAMASGLEHAGGWVIGRKFWRKLSLIKAWVENIKIRDMIVMILFLL